MLNAPVMVSAAQQLSTLDIILASPALWGFLGSFLYASMTLVAAIWGDNPAQGPHRKRVLAEFWIALMVGPVIAEGFGPSVFRLNWLAGFDHRSISLSLGLAGNYLWPVVVLQLGMRVRDLLGKFKQP